ncbi:MAG: ESX secretion-associated protein EspG [Nocardia sp.]|nr:ESX secretion-associated protein EspG [Nocardia sp.]
MNRRWSFDDLEFSVLWELHVGDRLPTPFIFTTDIEFEDDYQRERVLLRDRLLACPDPALAEALADCKQPDISIMVRGFGGSDGRDPAEAVFLRAIRREDRGYLLTQLPGRTIIHSGGYTIAECPAVRLAEVIADAMPAVPKGTWGRITLPPDPKSPSEATEYEPRDSVGGAQLWDSYEEPVEATGRRLLSITPDRSGEIEIAQGVSRFGPRGRTVRRLGWRDLPDDGRYVIAPGPPPVAIGVDDAGLIDAVNAEIIAVVRAIKDERV